MSLPSAPFILLVCSSLLKDSQTTGSNQYFVLCNIKIGYHSIPSQNLNINKLSLTKTALKINYKFTRFGKESVEVKKGMKIRGVRSRGGLSESTE